MREFWSSSTPHPARPRRRFTAVSKQRSSFPFNTRDFVVIAWTVQRRERKRGGSGGGHGDPSCARRAAAGPPLPPLRPHHQRYPGDFVLLCWSNLFPWFFFSRGLCGDLDQYVVEASICLCEFLRDLGFPWAPMAFCLFLGWISCCSCPFLRVFFWYAELTTTDLYMYLCVWHETIVFFSPFHFKIFYFGFVWL